MSMTTSDKLSAVNTVIAVLGFVIVIWQLSVAVSQISVAERNQRAQYLSELYTVAFASPAMRRAVRDIEYGRIEYEQIFSDAEVQENLVVLLSFFELLGHLEALGTMRFSDIERMFGYYIRKTWADAAVQRYLAFLERSDRLDFQEFRRLAEKQLAGAGG